MKANSTGTTKIFASSTERFALFFIQSMNIIEELNDELKNGSEKNFRKNLADHWKKRQILFSNDFDFRKDTNGKPHLIGAPGFLNWSHTDGLTVLAYSELYPIGVDVEKIKDFDQKNRLPENWLEPNEKIWISNAPHRSRAILDLWTRKEAFLKATGEGLSGLKHRVDLGGPLPLTIEHAQFQWELRKLPLTEFYEDSQWVGSFCLKNSN